MPPRILILITLLVLSLMSQAAFAMGAGTGYSAHVHVHKHGGTPHQHTHNDHNAPVPDEPDDIFHEAPTDDHHHCCDDHSHHPEQVGDGLTVRNRDLVTFPVGIASILSDLYHLSTREFLLRWPPLHQRPPDYLRVLRTCVMLN